MGAVTLVAIIITILVSMNFKSIQSLQIAQMQNKTKTIQFIDFVNKEKNVFKTAINDYCSSETSDGCWSGVETDQTILKTNIDKYKPTIIENIDSNIFFTNTKLNQRYCAIETKHTLKDASVITKYANNANANNELVSCVSGTMPACINNEIISISPMNIQNTFANLSTEDSSIDATMTSGTLKGNNVSLMAARKNALTSVLANFANYKTEADIYINVVLPLKNSGTLSYKEIMVLNATL